MNRALNTCTECGRVLPPSASGRCVACTERSPLGTELQFEERTDDPHTIPAIPGSALEPAAPYAFAGGRRGRSLDDDDVDDGSVGAHNADGPRYQSPTIDRVAHEIDAPLPPRALRPATTNRPQAGQPVAPTPPPTPRASGSGGALAAPPTQSLQRAPESRPTSRATPFSLDRSGSAFVPPPSAASDAGTLTPPVSVATGSAGVVQTAPVRATPAPALAAALAVDPSEVDLIGEDRWLSARSVVVAIGAAGWAALLAAWMVLAIYVWATGRPGLGAIVVGGILHVWIALAIGYVAIALLVNRTWVRLEARGLGLVHGPVPWPSRTVPVRSIERVDVVPAGAQGVHDVLMVLNGAGPVVLARGLDAAAARVVQARWTTRLEQVEAASAGR